MTVFLCGDVMTGRGIDQILNCPSNPRIYESYVRDAREYVELAELRNGPIPRSVTARYIWGDALAELERMRPDVTVINLETSITTSDDYSKEKGIHYRMQPANVACLTAAGTDVCGLANNHVLDFGRAGLAETLDVLTRAGVKTTGAGGTLADAQTPAIVPLGSGSRLMVFAFGTDTSGIPRTWAANESRPGVDMLPDLSDRTAAEIVGRVQDLRGQRDIVVASIHWGTNWGYDVSADHVRFARSLIDGGIDIVHGHSSHHPRPIEVHRNRLILYGCGDFIDDYEGIEGHERYRGDLALMYFAVLSPGTGELAALRLAPMQIRNMRLNRPSPADSQWLRDVLARISAPFDTHIELMSDEILTVPR